MHCLIAAGAFVLGSTLGSMGSMGSMGSNMKKVPPAPLEPPYKPEADPAVYYGSAPAWAHQNVPQYMGTGDPYR